VYTRGQRREVIFYSDADKAKFLERLCETIQKYRLKLHAYVLMDNHFHLLLETPEGNLTKAMHYFNASYSNWFRTKHQLHGSIFQGRYKAILVEKEKYLIELSSYIHLNPVRAGTVENPEEYKWSSYRRYCDMEKGLPFLHTQEILDMLGGSTAYRKFIHERLGQHMEKEAIYGKNSLLGGELFKSHAIKQLSKRQYPAGSEREISDLKRLQKVAAKDIKHAIIQQFHIDEGKLLAKQRGNIYRKLYLYGLKKFTVLSLAEIGTLAAMDYAAVSELVRRFERESKEKKDMQQKIDLLEKTLRI